MDEQDYETEFENFKETFEAINPLIQKNIAEAARLLNEAADLAEKHGIPFKPQEEIMFCRPSYFPGTFSERFPLVHKANFEDGSYSDVSVLTKAYGYYHPYGSGWQQSQVC